ncbi:MAG: AraC family transcriptional regulator [Rhizobium sp.]|nr:AraC family transcriptional regulator [Rhizobium sp.]
MKTNVPTYGLYGEASDDVPDFWVHAESIFERSSRHSWEIKRHRHEHFLQILQIRGGTGDAMIGDAFFRLEPGSLVFIPEKITHGFRFSRDIDGQVITTITDRLPLHGADSHRPKLFVARPRLVQLSDDSPDSAYISTTLDRIGRELSSGFGARYSLIETYLSIVLTLVSGFEASIEEEDAATSRDVARITRLNELIGGHYREHLPVEFYANKLGVSVTHLNRITKAQTGRTMNELLSDRIISQAKRDLVFTISTAQEIAYTLGFADPAYFTRFFSREAGETPRQFRERERGRQVRPKAAAE